MLQSTWSTGHFLPQTLSDGTADNSSSSKTHAFFASSFDPPIPPPTLTRSPSTQSAKADAPGRARSLNVDFFAITPPSLIQSPPSSISRHSSGTSSSYSDSSDPSSIESPSSLSPPSSQILSRLFPSRYRTVDDVPSSREFLDIQSVVQEDIFAPEDTPKPSSTTPRGFSICFPDTPKPIATMPSRAVLLETQLSTSPPEDSSSLLSPDRLSVHTSLSMSMDMLPTPAGSRNASLYEPVWPVPNTSSQESDHLAKEPRVESITAPVQEGSIVTSDETDRDQTVLHLLRALGHGSFSSVWLGRDDTGVLEKRFVSRKVSIKRQQSNGEGLVRRKSSKRLHSRMEGIKPWQDVFMNYKQDSQRDHVHERDPSGSECPSKGGMLFAVKLTERALCDADERTRVSFIREVEVLRHISHPSIVSYIHSFTTPTHHCLVLERIEGVELFDVINSDEKYSRMNEPLLRRIWGELCKAVGWLHEVALVHRDIKLENILLTNDLQLPSVSTPLVKLTDFGLSRFIDPKNPLLTTRCGSESYAAPEIITGKKYDGRETDAWACGVVLYALATRNLPFESASSRKAMLMKIAKGEYEWPEDSQSKFTQSEGIRRLVGRLLIREPRKRSKVKHLWHDEWMLGEGAPIPPPPPTPPLPPLDDPKDDDLVDDALEEVLIDDGIIVDGDQISSIASQELQ